MNLVSVYEFGVKDTLRMSGLPDPLLHLLLGVALLLLIAAGTRRPLSSLLPLGLLFGIELANEFADSIRWNAWLIENTLEDFAVTLIVPTMIFAFARAGLLRPATPAPLASTASIRA